MFAISGDNANCMRWIEIWMNGGTTTIRFYDFIKKISIDLDANFPGQSFLFTMGNLKVHKNPIILSILHNIGHRYVFCAPYWPVNGAVEYVFNTVQT